MADPVTGITPTTSGYAREAFVNNQLPAGRLDANAVKLLSFAGARITAASDGKVLATVSDTSHGTQFDTLTVTGP